MKLSVSKLFGAFLAVGALSGNYEAHATPYRYIGERGVIQAVDYTNSSVTILDKKKVAETFVWNSNTWFREKAPKPCASWISRFFSFGETTNAASLQPGRTVTIYYRRAYGHFLVREIVVSLPSPGCSCPARR